MAYVNGEIIAERVGDWFERLLGSRVTERIIRAFLLIVIGWFLGYLQFRFQFPI